MAGMRELGYLPGEPSEWDSDLLFDDMHEVSWWLHAEEPLRLAPEDLSAAPTCSARTAPATTSLGRGE